MFIIYITKSHHMLSHRITNKRFLLNYKTTKITIHLLYKRVRFMSNEHLVSPSNSKLCLLSSTTITFYYNISYLLLARLKNNRQCIFRGCVVFSKETSSATVISGKRGCSRHFVWEKEEKVWMLLRKNVIVLGEQLKVRLKLYKISFWYFH